MSRHNVSITIDRHQIGLRQRMGMNVYAKVHGEVQVKAIDGTWEPLVDLTWTNAVQNVRIRMGERDS